MPELEGLELEVDSNELEDPGIKEGTGKKDPRLEQDKISADSPRYKEIYKNWKDAERRLEKLEKDKGNSDLIDEMRRHNKSLEETIKQINTKAPDDGNELKVLTDQLEEFKQLKKQAREKADFDAETRIDDSISDLKLDIRELKKQSEIKKVEKVEKTPELSREDESEYKTWISENEWFTKDQKKRASAITFEKQVIIDPNFKDASIVEILEEVRVRVEEKFKPVEGKTAVEAGERGGSTRVSGSVRLSTGELDIAKGLGVSPENYAKQKMLINQRKGK